MKVAVAVAVTAVLAGGGGFAAGRLTSGTSTSNTAQTLSPTSKATIPSVTSAPGGSTATPTTPMATALSATDPAGDAKPHPVDGRTYGPADIIGLTVKAVGTNLVITATFAAGVDMTKTTGQIGIKLDPNKPPTCIGTVLPGSDFAVTFEANTREDVLRAPTECEGRWTDIGTTYTTISGQTATATTSLSPMGLRPGQRIAIRMCADTRIDHDSTTLIQDYGPDDLGGVVGVL